MANQVLTLIASCGRDTRHLCPHLMGRSEAYGNPLAPGPLTEREPEYSVWSNSVCPAPGGAAERECGECIMASGM